jgi:hypothetical protein
MNTRPPEPQFLIDYREWMRAGPPKCCHTCDHFTQSGNCLAFDMQPPDEFAETVGECPRWIQEIPF